MSPVSRLNEVGKDWKPFIKTAFFQRAFMKDEVSLYLIMAAHKYQ